MGKKDIENSHIYLVICFNQLFPHIVLQSLTIQLCKLHLNVLFLHQCSLQAINNEKKANNSEN